MLIGDAVMRKSVFLIISMSLCSTAAVSGDKGPVSMNGEPMTAAYARSVTKDALNTTPHISNKASDSHARKSKRSNESKGRWVEIERPDPEMQLDAIKGEIN